jgi:hypothetical protein
MIPLWTQNPLQFGPASSIFFLSLLRQLTRVTFTLSAYLNLIRTTYPILTRAPYPITSMFTRPYNWLTRSYPISLLESHPNTLPEPYPITSMFTWPYMFIPGRITLPDHFPVRLPPTRLYLDTLPSFMTRSGNTSLHSTAYPALPNHLIRPGTLQLTSPENFLIGLPP